jgi:hypothetical protein
MLQVLFSSGGYTFLDVRSEAEVEDSGKVRGSVNVSMVRARKVYSPEAQKKLVASEPVDPEDWIAQVAKRFPNRGTPLLVGGSADGRHLVLEALQALEDKGYTNIVKLKWVPRGELSASRALSDLGAGEAAVAG